MFHLIRFAHIADSLHKTAWCQELCAMEYSNALFIHANRSAREDVQTCQVLISLHYCCACRRRERDRLTATGSDQIFDMLNNGIPLNSF